MALRPELKRLHLRRPLRYRALDPRMAPAPDTVAFETGAVEGEERIYGWAMDDVVRTDPAEGPRIVRPLPPPVFAGSASASDPATTQVDSPERSELELETGAWLLAQAPGFEEAPDLLEWFVREAWWEREAAIGPLYLRYVREDGKWAIQALRRRAAD